MKRAVLLLAAPVLFIAARAHAQRQSPAEALFEDGQRLMAAHDYAAACNRFTLSKQLEPGIGVRLWLAECLESAGKTASAWREFDEAATAAGKANDGRESVARARAARLQPTLSGFRFDIPDTIPAAATLDCDEQPVPRAAWRQMVPADPGAHHLRVRLGRAVRWEKDVTLGAGAEIQPVRIVLEETSAPPSPPPPPPPHAAEDTGETTRLAGLAIGGAGIVALGLGTYFGIAAANDSHDSNGECTSQYCTAQGRADRASATHEATASTILVLVGGAAVAGGVLLYVWAPRGGAVAAALGPGSLHFSANF